MQGQRLYEWPRHAELSTHTIPISLKIQSQSWQCWNVNTQASMLFLGSVLVLSFIYLFTLINDHIMILLATKSNRAPVFRNNG